MAGEGLFTPYTGSVGGSSDNDLFIGFLNVLEGYKTKFKNLHWSARNEPIHVRIDEFLDIIGDYQDSVAEEHQGLTKQLDPNVIHGIPVGTTDPIEALESLLVKTREFYVAMGDGVEMVGLRSETEVFLHEIGKYIYLFRICKY